MSKGFYFLLISLILISNIIMATDSQAPYRTIRAGEAYTDPLSGEEVSAGNRTKFSNSYTWIYFRWTKCRFIAISLLYILLY